MKSVSAKRSLLLLPLTLAGGFFLNSCEQEGADIYCSFYPIYYVVRSLTPSHISVENVTPSGVEPHDYEPSAVKIAKMSESKAVFVNGLSFENWISSSSPIGEKIHPVSQGIGTIKIDGVDDPHIWLNPLNLKIEAGNVMEILIELYPQEEESIQSLYEDFVDQMDELDAELEAASALIENKNIVTSHAAFGYFAEAYGFNQIHLNGLSPDEEPTAKEIETIIEAIERYGIKTIYYEEEVSSDIAEAIASSTGCATMTLNPLETLSPERLEEGDDYLSIMRENMKNLQEGQA